VSAGHTASPGPGDPWADGTNVRAIPSQVSAAVLERRFPGVVAWYGRSTRRWWAMVSAGGTDRLIEAASPDELAAAIATMPKPIVSTRQAQRVVNHDVQGALRAVSTPQTDRRERPAGRRRALP
jgi:hypothetical protein